MIPPFDYQTPKTLKEACDLLWEASGRAKIIAGGTDLVIGLRNGDTRPDLLIDVTSLKELRRIEEDEQTLSIGAAVTHSEIADSLLVRRYGRILSKAVSEIGSPQIRNLGTIGGNIVNASPAADSLPPLLVLNAVGIVSSYEGEREVPIAQLIQGPYQTVLKAHEILVRLSFRKLSKEMRSGFIRLARREAMAIARMSMAIILRQEEGRIKEIRVSPGSIFPAPQRLIEVEDYLTGKVPDEGLFLTASKKVSETMIHRSGIRASTSYKAPVVEALFLRAIRRSLEEEDGTDWS